MIEGVNVLWLNVPIDHGTAAQCSVREEKKETERERKYHIHFLSPICYEKIK